MSTLKVNTLEEATSGGATFFTAKAWVNFNGKNTVAIRADGNVSSITDNGTGNYNVNLSSASSDANYSASATASAATTYTIAVSFDTNDDNFPRTTTSIRLLRYFNSTYLDVEVVDVVFTR